MQSNTALQFSVTAIEALRDKFNLANWTAGDPCSDVNWIECSGAYNNVESLLLTNTNLTGTIPSEFTNLKSIITIEMSNNPKLIGPLPDLTEASSIVTFNVSFCALGGQIPDLKRSGGLDVLHLQNNNFAGPIPPALFQHGFLRNVNVRNNQLTTVPVKLTLLERLKTMNLANNLISGILPDLPAGNSQPDSENRLELLTFSNNFFSGGIPESWEQLIYLKEIYLNNNNLTGPIPSYFGKLKALLILDLRNNQFNGTVPQSLAELPNLKTLLLDNNKFTEIPQSLLDRKTRGLNISFSNNPNISITVDEQQEPLKSKSGAPIGIIAGVAAVVIIGIGLGLAAFFYVRRRKSKPNLEQQVKPEDMPKSAQSFTFKEVKTITSNFKTSIGKGGFGDVYYGKLPDGKEVAVKVRASNSTQGADEFLNEVRLLSRLHHRNLVCLVGYCLEAQQQILIYVYMPKGTLHDHLYPKGASSTKKSALSKKLGGAKHELLSWKKRVDIVMNAARGLEYLHKDCKPPVIHRDVKSENILLTDELQAKLADLGISRQAPELDVDKQHVNTGIITMIKGTFGYLDPEYYVRRKLTTKSDVFSFGMVLLEIITGRKPQSYKFPDSEATTLLEWVRNAVKAHEIETVVDPTLGNHYHKEGMIKVAELALSCQLPTSGQRPDMGEIVRVLKQVLQLEQVTETEYSDDEDKITILEDIGVSYDKESESINSIASTSVSMYPYGHSSWNTLPR
ncbi:hypothetical protein AXG93_2105s1000 [Marchantia polymorpha subsp. ruderalis]|uniref:Protein kinase domain-containing protein n=1 Tax=Marchantia polymorpha subsp. ruderalis TaxID=1480154 RepID=A0A176VMD2_MARPO|nr:hypothetical protein AXG93_2105s1000 [Marchantia polymorpha subsp. ruderalis]